MDRPADRDQGPLLVDAMNVIGSRANGWWHDPATAVRRFVAELQALAEAAPEQPVVVVVDGPPVDGLPEGRHGAVEVRYARRTGRDAADDRIVELVAEADGVAVVVTADRGLRDRVRELGAAVRGPRELLDHLGALP